jgi:hypothetical protein
MAGRNNFGCEISEKEQLERMKRRCKNTIKPDVTKTNP